jgi:hypothetical protein
MTNDKSSLGTTLTTEQRCMLDDLCNKDRRTISATLGLLIEREWQRRQRSEGHAPIPTQIAAGSGNNDADIP